MDTPPYLRLTIIDGVIFYPIERVKLSIHSGFYEIIIIDL